MFRIFCKKKLEESLSAYYDRRKKEVDREVALYEQEVRTDYRERVAKEWQQFEHTYHSGMEIKKSELARLDALIEARKTYLEELGAEKDKTIEVLSKTLSNLTIQVKTCNCSYKKKGHHES